MYVLVIHHHNDVTAEGAQALAAALGVTAFDARQRLICNSPVVVSTQAEREQAEIILNQLQNSGFHAFIVDVEEALNNRPVFIVRSFKFGDDQITVHDSDGRKAAIPYKDIKVILPATRTTTQTREQTVTERKFSVGKTVMMGGIPMSKKVTRQETVSTDDREHTLYMCSSSRARLVCGQDMDYEGLADEMKPTRDMNHRLFISKICQKCPGSIFDERLLKRSEQVKLLGPMLDPDRYIDLAVDILVTSSTTKA